MRKLILTGFIACTLLLAQSCSKKQIVLPAKALNSAKQVAGIPTGFMTGILPTGTYKFISAVSTVDPATNKSIGVTGGSTASGALIEQRDFVDNVQEWRITQTGFGTYSVINYNSGLALDNTGHALVDNNPIQQWPFTEGHTAQQWVIEYQGLGVYRFKSVDNLNMGIHVKDGSTANGANIVLKTFAGSGAVQQWGYFFAYAMPISAAPVTIFTPDASHAVNYPRILKLTNGNLFASFDYSTTNVFDPNVTAKIYRSTNNGSSWAYITDIPDTHRNLGLHEPNPFVIPTTIGSVPAGSIICGVRSGLWDADYIDVYRSNDNGTNWTYMSNVATGIDFNHNLFEPFFLVDASGRLICYYSDCRDPAHSQKLVYQVSTDNGLSWGATVTDVVALPAQVARPGMFRASKMGNGKWIMDYEYVDTVAKTNASLYFKISTDGVNWGTVSSPGTIITSIDGVTPNGTPGILWTSAGSTAGTVIAFSAHQIPASTRGSDNFVNFNYGTGNWYRIPQPLPYDGAFGGYSRSIASSFDGKTLYYINKVATSATNSKIQFVATSAW